jgi:hypothetical protein
MEYGERLSEEQQAKLAEAMRQAKETIEAAKERERIAPKIHFFNAAIKAGFTALQAEFLWDAVPRHRPLTDWKA